MGLRGPGARAKGSPKAKGAPSRRPPPAWDAKGLSRAERIIRFIESLRITSGAHAGRKFRLRPWQRTILRSWYATDRDGRRIVRTGLLTMARKQGKTALCSALALAHLLGPEVEARGQVIAAATDRDQSSLIFDELVAFIRDNPAFDARCNIQRHAKIIEDLPSGTKFRALSSDAAKAHGMNPSVIIVDELAQWGMGSGRKLFTALTTATGARAEPLTLVISTQTSDPHNLMSELTDYGKEVNAGRITDPTFAAHIFEVPLDADIWDEGVWPLANPALGDFRSLDEMQIFAARAKRTPGQVAPFRQYYLNQRVESESRWLDLEAWDACAVPADPAALDALVAAPRTRRAFLGLDLASTTDLTALAIVLPTDDGFELRMEFWVPAASIPERERTDRVPYALWRQQGWLHATEGNTTDYAFIEQRIYELLRMFEVREVACDPWNAHDCVTRLRGNGVPVIEVQQTMGQLSAPSKALETLILSGRLRHDGSPVMRWNVANVVADVDANANVKPNKRRSTERIDGVSALITALARALVDRGPSAYERQGALVL